VVGFVSLVEMFFMTEKSLFIEVFKKRTKQMAINAIRLFQLLPNTEEARVMGKQLVRSASSTAANYRAACRARSQQEFFAKISIVIEECDETLFWLELIEESMIYTKPELKSLQTEVTEILRVVSKARKTLST
jgi:four helix bundle protein